VLDGSPICDGGLAEDLMTAFGRLVGYWSGVCGGLVGGSPAHLAARRPVAAGAAHALNHTRAPSTSWCGRAACPNLDAIRYLPDCDQTARARRNAG
jgi:hypothetical protein